MDKEQAKGINICINALIAYGCNLQEAIQRLSVASNLPITTIQIALFE